MAKFDLDIQVEARMEATNLDLAEYYGDQLQTALMDFMQKWPVSFTNIRVRADVWDE